ncbi:hypothetical protein E2C01_080465 [Portunus trituberculatus]|uniref:Uncharacterized protein n=1 Tax=Portunus trituberculatus TaxID=210409 RepID=A0A5B7IJT2_PORTR|nr:hypothetical protein [Portunus trituberculatus]
MCTDTEVTQACLVLGLQAVGDFTISPSYQKTTGTQERKAKSKKPKGLFVAVLVVTPKKRLGDDMGPNMGTTMNKIACDTNGGKLKRFFKHTTGARGHGPH